MITQVKELLNTYIARHTSPENTIVQLVVNYLGVMTTQKTITFSPVKTGLHIDDQVITSVESLPPSLPSGLQRAYRNGYILSFRQITAVRYEKDVRMRWHHFCKLAFTYCSNGAFGAIVCCPSLSRDSSPLYDSHPQQLQVHYLTATDSCQIAVGSPIACQLLNGTLYVLSQYPDPDPITVVTSLTINSYGEIETQEKYILFRDINLLNRWKKTTTPVDIEGFAASCIKCTGRTSYFDEAGKEEARCDPFLLIQRVIDGRQKTLDKPLYLTPEEEPRSDAYVCTLAKTEKYKRVCRWNSSRPSAILIETTFPDQRSTTSTLTWKPPRANYWDTDLLSNSIQLFDDQILLATDTGIFKFNLSNTDLSPVAICSYATKGWRNMYFCPDTRSILVASDANGKTECALVTMY